MSRRRVESSKLFVYSQCDALLRDVCVGPQNDNAVNEEYSYNVFDRPGQNCNGCGTSNAIEISGTNRNGARYIHNWGSYVGGTPGWALSIIGRNKGYTGRTFTKINVSGTPGDRQWHQQPRDNNRHFNAQFGGITEARSFINRSGQFTAVDVRGLPVVQAHGISNNGTIVGWASTCGNCQRHRFVRSAQGQISRLDIALAFDTFLTGVNDEGVIVGYYNTGFFGPVTGFLRQRDGAMFPIPRFRRPARCRRLSKPSTMREKLLATTRRSRRRTVSFWMPTGS